jgi:two-component system, sensor histidine kinase SagS
MPVQPTSQPRQRVLLLADGEGITAEWLSLLQERGDVRVVSSLSEAQAALHDEHFDVVLCAGPELLPLASDLARDQARHILGGIAEGVCTIGREGSLIWSNAALRANAPEVVEAIRAAGAEMMAQLVADRGQRVARRTVSVGQKLYFELTASALFDEHGEVDRAAVVASDTTATTRVRERLDAIDAAGRELVGLDSDANARLEVPERLRLLEDKVIRYCRDLLDFTHFAVRVLDSQTGRLDVVLAGGFSEEAKAVQIFARETDNGISGYVAATGRSYICPDVAKDPLYLPGFECAASSLTVPLRLNERVVGILNVETDRPAAFSDEDRQVAEIFGRYIAVALQTLKLLVVERSETTGQLAADVRAEVSEPLDDIVAAATHLLQAGASSMAEERLHGIIEKVERVKEALQRMAKPPVIRGLMPEESDVNPALAGKRVLVADDEDIIRETVADVLSKIGALPVMARDGEEAVAMIRSQRFDLVLSDIKMPYKNGYEVFAAAKEMSAGCPVILITGFGYDPEHSIVRASREGLAGVLFKPFKVEQLLEMIQKAVTAES